jgi:hypothetical protein
MLGGAAVVSGRGCIHSRVVLYRGGGSGSGQYVTRPGICSFWPFSGPCAAARGQGRRWRGGAGAECFSGISAAGRSHSYCRPRARRRAGCALRGRCIAGVMRRAEMLPRAATSEGVHESSHFFPRARPPWNGHRVASTGSSRRGGRGAWDWWADRARRYSSIATWPVGASFYCGAAPCTAPVRRCRAPCTQSQ